MYVGNLDFASDAASVASGLARLLGPALASSARATEVPGWVDRRRADGTPKPRKKRDAGKRNRGFAVLEFPDAALGRDAAAALHGATLDGRALRSSAGVRVRRSDAEDANRADDEDRGAPGEEEAAREARRARREHDRRQKRRRKRRDDAALEATLDELLLAHPARVRTREDEDEDEDGVVARGGGVASSRAAGRSAAPVEMWWDSDEDWRRGWGSLYSRWADEPSAAASASVDWSAVPPSADPARNVRRGGAARGRRKRAQVESFLAILYASAALRSSLRDGDGDADGDADASSRGDGVGITVVDFGCGTGNLLLPLAALHPSVTFVGVDVNPRSIALLLERAKAARLRNVSAETGLIESYRGPAFDVALALHVCGEGTDAAMLQAQARNAAFVVAPCCVGKLKDGGLRSIEALKRDASANVSDAFEDEDGAAARFSVIHPRSAWMRGRVQRPAYLGLAAAADWSGHDGVRAEEADASLARLPRAAKAAVEADRAASAAEAGFGVRLMKMLARDAGLKNDLIVGFPSGKDPMGERKAVRGPNLHSTNSSS